MSEAPSVEAVREALGEWATNTPTEGFYSIEHVSGVPAIRLALIHPDGGAQEVESLFLDAAGVERLVKLIAAARDWLRIQENSETIWWCEVHKTQAVDPMFKCYNPTPHGVPRPCRMVERRLI